MGCCRVVDTLPQPIRNICNSRQKANKPGEKRYGTIQAKTGSIF
ncbi:hypothetical protein HRM2_28430 [Desulforapulum autotrophicum HRM2]|uniref:Uncharacterized protein n=1 Tax=Desulforapulum autotrophicum (strain ATCC 43914 / DSM 3382 / VKM B-1955 / HRM2) TaxID=177437 RepID=C0QJB8_DESAH|nr:hypothetical protein HRM2_28430 [Desulforapulum autotrophicum HRM2]